jgi:hypothetical protein
MALKTITLNKYGHGRLIMTDCRKVIVVYLCMLSVFRPSFELVKEGRILHFVSGSRRFEFSEDLIASGLNSNELVISPKVEKWV